MNRDREAIARIVWGFVDDISKTSGRTRQKWVEGVIDRLAALPVGGGVELRDALHGIRQRLKPNEQKIVVFRDEAELILAALSSRVEE